MKIIKYLIILITVIYSTPLTANEFMEINQIRRDEKYNEPVYKIKEDRFQWKDKKIFYVWVNSKLFPISSKEQGSVIIASMIDCFKNSHFVLIPLYAEENFEDLLYKFNFGDNLKIKSDYKYANINGVFGVYYENIKYSRNKYLYPAFFENKIYVITNRSSKAEIKQKDDLKNFKGIYAGTDYLSSFILKDFKDIGIKKVKDFATAYEELLTEKADYIVASYYPSIIELYKLGIRDYVLYSKEPIWKAPMFIRITPEMGDDKELNVLKKCFKSEEYKKKRDNLLEEMVEIYRKNTEGIVPPTYINTASKTKEITPVSEIEDSPKSAIQEIEIPHAENILKNDK